MSREMNPDPALRSHQPNFDQDPLNFGSQSAATTFTTSIPGSISSFRPNVGKTPTVAHVKSEEVDDQQSVASVYSYRSDIDARRLLRRVDGRVFNALNETYPLPSDEYEWIRLNKQHAAFVLAFDGLYPAKETVDAVLAPQEGIKKRILDLGTGTGIWAVDMAKKFPHAEVIGVDVAPVPMDPENVPPNCEFEVDDIELGLTHFHQPSCQFDLIHVRLLSMGIKDFHKTSKDVQSCLRKGGLLIWIEGDYEFFTPDIHVYQQVGSDTNPNGSWIARFLFETMRSGMKVGRSDFAGAAEVMDRGFWNEPLLDPATCRTASLYLPTDCPLHWNNSDECTHCATHLAPWANHADSFVSQRLRYIGMLVGQDIREALGGAQNLFMKAGWPIETIAQWQRRVEEELSSMELPIQVRFRIAWGRRKNQTSLPASPSEHPNIHPSVSLPAALTLQTGSDVNSIPSSSGGVCDNVLNENDKEDNEPDLFSSSIPYPLLYIYETEEEALQEDVLRKQSKQGFAIPPSPSQSPTPL